MYTEDRIYKKLQNASKKGEKDFPAIDKLWSRVEEKLDNQVVVKKKNIWQKLAVAASVAFVSALVYIFALKKEITTKNIKSLEIQSNEIIVSKDSAQRIIEEVKENVATTNKKQKLQSFDYTTMKDNVYKKSEMTSNLNNSEKIVSKTSSNGKITARSINSKIEKDEAYLRSNFTNNISNMASLNNNYIINEKIYVREEVNHTSTVNNTTKKIISAPIVIVNGNVVKNNLDNDSLSKNDVNKITTEEVETVILLKEPLYIINGVEYSEESLYGKNPTSPYTPLDQQKIKTVEVLQAPEAISRYGEKGKKGIVIITTINGKPIFKK